MAGADLSLFVVRGFYDYSNRILGQMRHLGDGHGERYSLLEHCVATSRKDAVAQIWGIMESRINQYEAREKEFLAKVQTLKGEGKIEEANALQERAQDNIGMFPPSAPIDRKEWTAIRVRVPGFSILIEPEVPSSVQAQ